MARLIFWDTSGFYSLLVSDDKNHLKVKRLVGAYSKEQVLSITTDWIVGEICNLLVVRRKPHLADRFLEYTDQSKFLRIYHICEDTYDRSRSYFRKHLDQSLSFTDCTSFTLMKDLKIRDAMTEDEHFSIAGFNRLL